jgi:ATP-dependent RNA helicase DeaD
MDGFDSFGLSAPLMRAVAEVGFEEPTPVQREAIPLLLQGSDVIAQAQTGTGKTGAFALPIIEQLDPDVRHPQALVLAPTRELAVQVAQTFHKLGKYRDVRVLAIYGGQPIDRQLRALRHPVDVIVGTPGRVMDHLRRETLSLDEVSMLVLDEADEMLNMGFIEDIEWILDHVPADRQTALFSATMPDQIARLAQKYLRKPVRVSIDAEHVTVPQIEQYYYEVHPRAKTEVLTRILDLETPASAIIFCRTKLGVDELAHQLQSQGYPAEPIHGDLSQAQRDRVMARFRSGQASLLIATDVAARGLDIPDVSHIFNYDIPGEPESYVHRIGRTGRAGRSGVAITLVSRRESRLLRIIERAIGQRIEQRHTPTPQQIAERQRAAIGQSLTQVLEQEEMLDTPRAIVGDLTTYFDPIDIAAAAVKLMMLERGINPETPPVIESDGGEDGMTRLFINLGRADGVRPMDVVGAIANEARIPGKSIGQIEIYDRYTYVDVPDEEAEQVVRAMARSSMRGKPMNIEVALPNKQPSQRRRDRRTDRR